MDGGVDAGGKNSGAVGRCRAIDAVGAATAISSPANGARRIVDHFAAEPTRLERLNLSAAGLSLNSRRVDVLDATEESPMYRYRPVARWLLLSAARAAITGEAPSLRTTAA